MHARMHAHLHVKIDTVDFTYSLLCHYMLYKWIVLLSVVEYARLQTVSVMHLLVTLLVCLTVLRHSLCHP